MSNLNFLEWSGVISLIFGVAWAIYQIVWWVRWYYEPQKSYGDWKLVKKGAMGQFFNVKLPVQPRWSKGGFVEKPVTSHPPYTNEDVKKTTKPAIQIRIGKELSDLIQKEWNEDNVVVPMLPGNNSIHQCNVCGDDFFAGELDTNGVCNDCKERYMP